MAVKWSSKGEWSGMKMRRRKFWLWVAIVGVLVIVRWDGDGVLGNIRGEAG